MPTFAFFLTDLHAAVVIYCTSSCSRCLLYVPRLCDPYINGLYRCQLDNKLFKLKMATSYHVGSEWYHISYESIYIIVYVHHFCFTPCKYIIQYARVYTNGTILKLKMAPNTKSVANVIKLHMNLYIGKFACVNLCTFFVNIF